VGIREAVFIAVSPLAVRFGQKSRVTPALLALCQQIVKGLLSICHIGGKPVDLPEISLRQWQRSGSGTNFLWSAGGGNTTKRPFSYHLVGELAPEVRSL
jgi:hypothetical protein